VATGFDYRQVGDPLWAGRVLGVTSYLEGPAATAAAAPSAAPSARAR
jgi:hypothetical protein